MLSQIRSQDETITKAKRLLAVKQLRFYFAKNFSFLVLISLPCDLENQNMFGKGLP